MKKNLDHKIKSIISGITAGIAFALLLSAAAAGVIKSEWVEENSMRYIVLIIHGLSGFVAGVTSGAISQEKKGLFAVIAGALYLVWWTIIAIAFGSGFQSYFASVLLSVFAGLMLALLLLKRPKRNKRHMYLKQFS